MYAGLISVLSALKANLAANDYTFKELKKIGKCVVRELVRDERSNIRRNVFIIFLSLLETLLEK